MLGFHMWTDANRCSKLAITGRLMKIHEIQSAECSYILLDPELLISRSEGGKKPEEVTRMCVGSQSAQSKSLLTAVALLVALCSMALPAEAARNDELDDQLSFGIDMARRGLWNEALFRFSRVLKERPGDVRVLNNMAVAYEAIGMFDQALEHYKRALEGDSSNRELRRNYAQFVEFYESLRPKEKSEPEPAQSKMNESDQEKADETADSTRQETRLDQPERQ